MAVLRAPAAPRHRPPGDTWWRVDLPELEVLVERGDHEGAYRLSRGLLEALEARRGCGPVDRRRVDDPPPCEACTASDRARDRVLELQMSARLSAPLSWTPPSDPVNEEMR